MQAERIRALGRGVVGDLLAVALAEYFLLVGTIEAASDQVPPRQPLDTVAYGLLVVAGGLFLLRRRAPLILLGAQALLAGAYLASGYPYGPLQFAVAAAAYLVAVRYTWPAAAPVLIGATAAMSGGALLGGRPEGLLAGVLAAGQAGWVVLPAVIAGAVRVSRAATARADRETRRRQVEEERLRLAREVHDEVGHSLSVISLQAGVALHVLDRRPEQAQPALEAIRRISSEALTELRTMLALTHPEQARRDPVAGLARLDTLVAEVQRCGLPVQVAHVGVARRLPGEVDLAALRVVQESLTNVLRHAGSARASVCVRYEPEHLEVVVRDDGGGGSGLGGEGHGLAGLRERVEALGGRLEAGPSAGPGWRVLAVLPTGADA